MSRVQPKRNYSGSHNDLEIKKLKSDSIQLEEFINFFSVPSLEKIAIVNVAVGIFKHADIRDAVRKHSMEYDQLGASVRGTAHNESVSELENNILNKLSCLPLPTLLKEKVMNIKSPILIQMLHWMSYYRKDAEFMDSVCWTVHGTIDKVKTFEQLVKTDTAQRHITFLYHLACTCCLEDNISDLWDRLPESMQKDYEETVYTDQITHLMAYWISIVKNESSGLLSKIKPYDDENLYDCNKSIYYNMIKLAMSQGNILAVRYFWNKLTAEEINSNLAEWINETLEKRKKVDSGYPRSNNFSDVLYFLLSQMDCPEKQKDILKKNSEVILTSLYLDWPWQRFLLPTIESIWLSLDEKAYVQLLITVVNDVEKNKTNERLLRQLWLDSPINLKKHFIQYIIKYRKSSDVIFNLLAIRGVQTLKLILNHANDEEKKRIIFSVVRNEQLFKLFYVGKIDYFDTLISETLSSDIDVHNFKKKIMEEYGDQLLCDWIHDANWELAEKFLKWAFTSQDQIDNFKNEAMDKMEITYRILRCEGNYEIVDNFLWWCFDSEEEILQFKENFAKSKYTIVEVGSEDWGEFEKFLSWCFTSDQDINVFKRTVLEKISDIVFSEIAFRFNFEFVDKLICWCCESAEEVKQFKARFVFSDTWLTLLDRFVSNYKVCDSNYNNWEITRKLIKLFSPLDREVILKLKEKIRSKFDYNDVWNFRQDFREISFPIKLKNLFCLIENPCFPTVSDKDSDSDDNNSATDNQG